MWRVKSGVLPLFLLLGLSVSFFSEGVPEAYSSTDNPADLNGPSCDANLARSRSTWPVLEEAEALLAYQGVKAKRIKVYQDIVGLVVESDSATGNPFNVYAYELMKRNGTSIIYYPPPDDQWGASFVAPEFKSYGPKAIMMPRNFLLRFDSNDLFFVHETEHAERHFYRADPRRSSILSVDVYGNLGGVAYQSHLILEELGTYARQVERLAAKLVQDPSDDGIVADIHRDLNIEEDIRVKANATVADTLLYLGQSNWADQPTSIELEDYGTVKTVFNFNGGFKVQFYVNHPDVVENYKNGRAGPENRPLIETHLRDQIAKIQKLIKTAEEDFGKVVPAFTVFLKNRTRENAEKLLADATLMADHVTELEMNSR